MQKILLFIFFLLTSTVLMAQETEQKRGPVLPNGPIPESAPRPAPLFKGVVISGVTLICKGGETTLKVEGDYESFEWNTGSTERMIRVKDAGQYEVTVKNKGGCTFTSSVNVEVRPCT